MPTGFATARIDPNAPQALPPRTGARPCHKGNPEGLSHGSRRLAAAGSSCTTAVCTQRDRVCGTYAAHRGHDSTPQPPTNAGHTEKRPMKPPRSKLWGITRKGIVCETPRFLTLFPLQANALRADYSSCSTYSIV